MNKSLFILCGTILALGASILPVYAFEDYSHINSDTKVCGDHICTPGEYIILQKQLNDAQRGINPQLQIAPINYFFSILKTPTGAELDNFVLSKGDYELLKNDVGIFTACGETSPTCSPPFPTTANPTVTFCPIAEMIHENEGTYNTKAVGNSDIFHATIPPAFCGPQPVPVPEFNIMQLPLFISILFGVCLVPKVKGRFK